MLDTRFIAFLGEGEPEELLPLDDAERERLLLDEAGINVINYTYKKYDFF